MIQQLMVDKMLDFMQTLSTKAVVVIDGIEHQYDYYLIIREENLIKKYVHLRSETGNVTAAHAVDSLGRHLESYTAQIEKGPDGVMIVFLLSLEIKGMVIT